jgi:DNA-binding NarL/FixJ family response regulator
MPDNPSSSEDIYREILTSIVKRFVLMVGAPAALKVARKIPRLTVDNDGNVMDFNRDDPAGTISLLIDGYAAVFGEAANDLVRQAAQSTAAVKDNSLLQEMEWLTSARAKPVEILLVDDHVLFREGLVGLLKPYPDLKVVGQAGSVREAIAMARELKPDLVLMDISLPDGTGQDATRAILAERPNTKILFLTFHEDDDELFEAIRAGAAGYMLKNVRPAELFKGVRSVAQGEAGISPAMARRILVEFARTRPPVGPPDKSDLTPREVEIVRELVRGTTNREIAQKFVVSESTVKNQVHSILSKLRLRSRRDVADYAKDHGLAPPPPDAPRPSD